jgi:SHS2 domain-containing protein
MEPIQYSGIGDLNEEERDILGDISSKSFEKIDNLLQEPQTSISVHIKTYKEKEETEKKKYSITVKAMSPKHMFRSGTSNWILANALNDAFDKVINEIKNQFRM